MRHLPLFCFFILGLTLSYAGTDQYAISVKINGVKDTICILANYYGDKQYIQDSAKVNSKGEMVFSGEKQLPGGIYLVALPGKKYFELIIDKEQHFSMYTDTVDLVKHMKIKGSVENKLFYDYLNFINRKQVEIEPLRAQLKKLKENKDSSELVRQKIADIDRDVKNYKLQFIKDHPTTFVANIFRAMQEPEVPEDKPKLPNGREDSTYAFRYYKAHFFDHLDFSDERLIRTPIFHNKIKQYLEQLTLQHPDSINAAADYLAEKAKANKELFKYTIYYITYTYETSNIMGMDAVFVHMAEKYYMTKKAFWVDSTQLAKITQRALQLKPLLIGKKAPNLILTDLNGEIRSLHDVNAKYTVLYFWDHSCSHCKKTTPKLVELYHNSLKSKGVEVFAVGTESNVEEWKKYINENKLDWINAYDPYHQTNFKKIYDIYSTPVIYLLNDKKEIMAKRIDVEKLEDFISMLEKEKEKEKKESK